MFLTVVLCMTVVCEISARAFDMVATPEIPVYTKELLELIEKTEKPEAFGSIQLTMGESEMVVDGESQKISENEHITPFMDAEGSLQIPGEALIGSSLSESETYSQEALEDAGYEVHMDDETGLVLITEPYSLCRIKVKTKSGKLLDTYNATQVVECPDREFVLQYATKEETVFAAKQFEADDNIIFCVADAIVTASSESVESTYKSWGTGVVDVDSYIRQLPPSEERSEIVIAVLDSGVDMNHPALKGRIKEGGYDFVDRDDNPEDENGHGTHCAGIISEATPENVKILPIRILDTEGKSYFFDIVEGLKYAINQNPDIISMSFGGYSNKDPFEAVFEKANEKGIVLVAAAGNDNINLDKYPDIFPACSRNVLTIGATTKSDYVAYYSNYGSVIDFVAPGTDVVSTIPGGGYQSYSGTSMAAPLAAACVALVKIKNPTYTKEEIYAFLKENARDIDAYGKDKYSGNGVLYLGEFRPAKDLRLELSELHMRPLETISIPVSVLPKYTSNGIIEIESQDMTIVKIVNRTKAYALRTGETDLIVRIRDLPQYRKIHVRVEGDETLQFAQITPCNGTQKMVRGDGTVAVLGIGGVSGYYNAESSWLPFSMHEDAYSLFTDVEYIYNDFFLRKKDGSVWLYGPYYGWEYSPALPVTFPDGKPLTNPKAVTGRVFLLSDGSIWKISHTMQPVITPITTPDGDPILNVKKVNLFSLSGIGVANEHYSVMCEGGLAFAWADGERIRAKNIAFPVCYKDGNEATKIKDVLITHSREVYVDNSLFAPVIGYLPSEFFILLENGDVVTETGERTMTSVTELVGCKSVWNKGIYAVKEDGTVWNAQTGTQIMKTGGEPLTNVRKLYPAKGRFFVLCEDNTVWAWGNNGCGTVNYNGDIDGFGVLGIGWYPENVTKIHNENTLTFSNVFVHADLPESRLGTDVARPVMVDGKTVLTNVVDVIASDNQTLFVRTDGSVHWSGLIDIKGSGSESKQTKTFAVYAIPMRLNGNQVYLKTSFSEPFYSSEKLQKINLNRLNMAAVVGEVFALKASFTPENALDQNIYWRSDDPEVATVDAYGIVTTLEEGTTVIRAYSLTDSRIWGGCVLNVEQTEPQRIVMRSYPTKREYIVGDSALDLSNGAMILSYPNGQKKTLFLSVDYCSGYDLTQSGTQKVTITFGGFSFSYTIYVKGKKTPEIPVEPDTGPVVGIRWVQKPKSVYYAGAPGNTLSLEGALIQVTYADGTTKEHGIDVSMCSEVNLEKIGIQTVKVHYLGLSLSYIVYVSQKKAVDMTWMEYPENTTAILGGEFFAPQAKLRVYYNNNTFKDIALTQEMCSDYDLEMPGEQFVTVSYEGQNCYYKINVVERVAWQWTPVTKEIMYGEPFAVPNAKIKVYNDDATFTTVPLTTEMCSRYDMDRIGRQDVTAKYMGYTLHFQIRVMLDESLVASVSIGTLPEKLIYGNFNRWHTRMGYSEIDDPGADVTGGTLDVVMQDGTTHIVPMSEGLVRAERDEQRNPMVTVYYANHDVSYNVIDCRRPGVYSNQCETAYILYPPTRTVFEFREKDGILDLSGGVIYVKMKDGQEAFLKMELMYYEISLKDSINIRNQIPGTYPVNFYIFRRYLTLYLAFAAEIDSGGNISSMTTNDSSETSNPETSKADTKTIWRNMPTKNVYCVGEPLDIQGGQYYFPGAGSDIRNVDMEHCTGYDPDKVGKQTITFTPIDEKKPDLMGDALTFDVYVTQLHIKNEQPQIKVSQCTRLEPFFAPMDIDNKTIMWQTSDELIATVDSYGKVTGVSPGNVTITAKVKGTQAVATCTISVMEDSVPTIQIADNAGAYIEGEYIFALPYGVTEKTVENVLSVSGGGHLEYHYETFFGTGTEIELVDDTTGEVVSTYTIVQSGDLNGDSVVNAADVVLLRSMLSDAEEFEEDATVLPVADLDRDGKITEKDVVVLRQMISGIIEGL